MAHGPFYMRRLQCRKRASRWLAVKIPKRAAMAPLDRGRGVGGGWGGGPSLFSSGSSAAASPLRAFVCHASAETRSRC